MACRRRLTTRCCANSIAITGTLPTSSPSTSQTVIQVRNSSASDLNSTFGARYGAQGDPATAGPASKALETARPVACAVFCDCQAHP
jgi:hypothetical protein